MKQLSLAERELVASLAKRLSAIAGIKAVVLGGSHARGRTQPGSDVDLGLLYSEAAPFSIQDIRDLAEEINDTPGPVVTDFYGWGALGSTVARGSALAGIAWISGIGTWNQPRFTLPK